MILRRACFALLVTGCGASVRAPTDAPPSVPPPVGAEAPGAAYERILGAFTIRPDAIAFVSPELARQHLIAGPAPRELLALAKSFAEARVPRGEAAARLHSGAVLWLSGQAEAAYVQVRRAQEQFATIGDLEGLAHAYEWMGFFLAESGSEELATESFALSRELFQFMGDRASADRILRYATAD